MTDDLDNLGPVSRKALEALRSFGRPMTTSEITELGVSRAILSNLITAGYIDRPVRGVYLLPSEDDDQRVFWACISLACDGVFCLTSAALYYGLTEENAGRPHVAILRDARVPDKKSLDISVDFHRWPDAALEQDIERIGIQGVQVKITSPARTIVDMFRHSLLNTDRRFQRVIAEDTFLDALSRYLESNDQDTKTRELHRVASKHGCWEQISARATVINATRDRMRVR